MGVVVTRLIYPRENTALQYYTRPWSNTRERKQHQMERERSENAHIDCTATIRCSGEDLPPEMSMILYL